MVDSAMASMNAVDNFHWGGSPFIESYDASFPATTETSDECAASLDKAVAVEWSYTDEAYPDGDDTTNGIVYRQCGYLNGVEMDEESFPSNYVDASHGQSYTISDDLSIEVIDQKRIYCIYTEYDYNTEDVADAALSSTVCMIGLRVRGGPIDILPDMGNGASGFNGVTLSWLDTYSDESEFNVYRRSQGTSATANSQVADVLVPSSKCGATVAPLTFTDSKTGYTPGARVIYTVIAKPTWADQDTDLGNFTGTSVYTVPWLSKFTATVKTNSGAGSPVAGVYVQLSHMLDSSTPDPLYDPIVYGYTDVNGDYSPLIRIVDETWSSTKQYFNVTQSLVDPVLGPHTFNPTSQVVSSTHIYGGSCNVKDTTAVSVRGYLRAGGGTVDSNPDRNFDKYWGDCGDQVLPSWEPAATAGHCYCALPEDQTIYMDRESGTTDSATTDATGYFEFSPMIGETVTIYYDGYNGSAGNTTVLFKLSDDVDDPDAVRPDGKAAAPSMTFTTDGDANVDFVTASKFYLDIDLLAGAGGHEFVTGQGFAVTADSCGFQKEFVTFEGVDSEWLYPLESYTITMYNTIRTMDDDQPTLSYCEDLAYDDVVSADDDGYDVSPCRVPIPEFSGDDRTPCATAEAGDVDGRVDSWFQSLDLYFVDGLDMSNGDVTQLFTYTSPVCLSYTQLSAVGTLTSLLLDEHGDRDADTEPYTNCGSIPSAGCDSAYESYQELLLLNAPPATPADDDGGYGGPTCINATSIFNKDEDTFDLSFKLVERYPGPVCAWPWQYEEYSGTYGYENTAQDCGSGDEVISLTNDNVVIEDAPTDGDAYEIDITLNDRVTGLTTTIEDTYDLTVAYGSAITGFGYVYEVTPAALNVFSPYTLQFSLSFYRGFDGAAVDFNRNVAVLGTAPEDVPRLYAATTDPTLIFAVLRDPPGGASTVRMEEGSSLGVSMSINGLHAGAWGAATSGGASGGVEAKEQLLTAPLGIGLSTTIEKIKEVVKFDEEQDSTVTTVTREGTKSFEFEFEFTTALETTDFPFEAGQPSDLIIGGGANLRILSALQVYASHSGKATGDVAGPQYCIQTQGTYEWFPETVTTYVLPVKVIEKQMERLAKQKGEANCEDSTSWYVSGAPSKDCDWAALAPASNCGGSTDDAGVNATVACPISCSSCPSTSLSAAELEEIQQAIDNWDTVLTNYRATSDRNEVATLQAPRPGPP